MCMHWMACLCWRDTKSPSVAIGVFALVTSLMQITISIAVFLQLNSSRYVDMQMATNPLYITLAAFDFVVVFLSILLLIGFERTGVCYHWLRLLWVVWMFLYILYESAINIYFFCLVFNNNTSMTTWMGIYKGSVIVFIVYWSVKEVILFTGWLFIVSHLCYGDSMAVTNSDQTFQVVTAEAIKPTSYSGVQIRDNPPTYVSNFDVVRPTSGCQVYGHNYGRGGGGGNIYMGNTRYM